MPDNLRTFLVRFAVCTVGGAAPIAAAAEEVTGSGTVTFVGEHISQRPIAGDMGLGQDHLRGVLLADIAENPLNLAAIDCIGSSLIDANGAPGDGVGYCDGIDKDGDAFFLWNRNAGESRTWQFAGGTGKYAKITGGGTTEWIAGEPADRLVLRWKGTWKTE